MTSTVLGETRGHQQYLPPRNPEQTLLLPPSPVDWLPPNHLVFFLLDLVAEPDLGEIHAYYRQKDPRGEKAYDPRMMVVLLSYAYCVGLPSSRKSEKTCWEDAAFRVLTGNQQPDHSRVSGGHQSLVTLFDWKLGWLATPALVVRSNHHVLVIFSAI